MIICILGRQPEFGLAELESRFGAERILPLGLTAAKVEVEFDDVPAHLLGSVVKIAKPITTFETTDWALLLDTCRRELPAYFENLPAGKLKLGLSTYGLHVNAKMLQRAGLELKKVIRGTGRSTRIVPSTAPELNSAQVLHNQLTSELGCELLFIRDGSNTHLAQTLHVQDIDDYAKRDFGRPKRDAFAGMLPPKLAQIMLNLAQVQPHTRMLDPFCGTGVVLQEAAIMECDVYGTDISERMIDYSRTNLAWLQQIYGLTIRTTLEVADATSAAWQSPIDAVACETYLGQPMTSLPQPEKHAKIVQQCNDIAQAFLVNLREQVASGTRCCIAVPAWFDGKTFLHLPVVDDLEKIGYNRMSFRHAGKTSLIYHRTDQIVARELLVLTVKE